MDYQQTLDYIHSLNKFGKKAGLNNITRLLALMGNPQDKLKYVHIAGTNGKGSTTTMIASVLQNAGYKTGKYISPFVIDFRERMQINNEMISQAELIECAAYVKQFADQMTAEGEGPIEFEVVTAIAFEWFARSGCDIVSLEVGLGGRYDATNVIKPPLASVICSISLDHVEILGDTIDKIAYEKCGIIKEGSVTVCYPDQYPLALEVIKEQAALHSNQLIIGDRGAVEVRSTGLEGTRLRYKGLDILLPLPGSHQINNFLNAVEALLYLREAHGYQISDACIEEGIAKVRFPARMELLHTKPTIILDGAHNQSGIDVLCNALEMVKDRKISLIIGMLGDKDFSSSLGRLAAMVDHIHTVTPPTPRALSAEKLAEQLKTIKDAVSAYESPEAAFAAAVRDLGTEDVLVICGSLYLATDMRRIVMEYFK